MASEDSWWSTFKSDEVIRSRPKPQSIDADAFNSNSSDCWLLLMIAHSCSLLLIVDCWCFDVSYCSASVVVNCSDCNVKSTVLCKAWRWQKKKSGTLQWEAEEGGRLRLWLGEVRLLWLPELGGGGGRGGAGGGAHGGGRLGGLDAFNF